MRLMLLTAALLAADADLGAVQTPAADRPADVGPGPHVGQVPQDGVPLKGADPATTDSRIAALEARLAALEAATHPHESLTSSPPMPRPGAIVMVREPHHPDYPAIVAEVVDDLGAIHANVFRGTHVPHAVNHLPNIEPGAEGPGWYWQQR